MWLLAQVANEMAEQPVPELQPQHLIFLFFIETLFSLSSIAYSAFFIWMLIHCYRTEPDQQFWFLIMIFVPFGCIGYFVLRYMPAKEFPTPAFFRRWSRGRELVRLETAAAQIGNAHQFVQWGDALREVGKLDQAAQAYDQALKKDPQNLQALWGAALVASSQKRFTDARSLTARVLEKDPQYKFGDVSLVHGRALNELGERDAARTHIEQHVRRWRHPEAMYLLAKLCADQGDASAARQHLTGMIQDINGSPAAIGRKFGRWKSRGRQLLRKLP